MELSDADRTYLDRLPIGQAVPFTGEGIPNWDIFPFAPPLTVKTLEAPVLPEPPRNGEDGPDGCGGCERAPQQAIWGDDDWLVVPVGPSAVPATVCLVPRAHHDFEDLPPELAADFGPMLQRLARAMGEVPGTGRVHLAKWGDGGAHLHWFAICRPIGMQQLRGSCLTIWDDVLPKLDEATWQRNLDIVAQALARDGGSALRA